ncbi:MAG TPA: hypothetical protein VHZ51_28445 [Ktedonobacteraceae bacterium]|jgi:hypothetical protein|nr:hypothetical protein [Ktedonobacteraceae bacterium]
MENTPEQPSEGKTQPSSPPLYEFSGAQEPQPPSEDQRDTYTGHSEVVAQQEPAASPDGPAPTTANKAAPTEDATNKVYPPPPSFYENRENIQHTNEQMPQRDYAPPIQPYQPMPMGQQPYGYGAPPVPGMPVPPPYYGYGVPPGMAAPRAKRSKAWIWILVSILIVLVLGGCSACSWLFFGAFSSAFQTSYKHVSGAINTSTSYYTALQNQQYSTAYGYLSLQNQQDGNNNLSQDAFIKQAQNADAQDGTIQSFIPGATTYSYQSNQQPDLNRIHMTMTVQRARKRYMVHLQLTFSAGQWKITQFDHI